MSIRDLAGFYRRRRVIPRWLPSDRTNWRVVAKNTPDFSAENVPENAEARAYFESWREGKGIAYLCDAFAAAVLNNDSSLLRPIVADVNANQARLSSQFLSVVNAYATDGLIPGLGFFISGDDKFCNEAQLRSFISQAKRALHKVPRNPLLWNDLAYSYALIAEHEKAARAALVAPELAKYHPIISRGCSRFFAHINELGTASRIIQTAQKRQAHPLLLSTQLAYEHMSGGRLRAFNRVEKYLKRGGNSNAVHSELIMAYASTYFLDGNYRKTRKILNGWRGIHTENSAAQGVWMNQASQRSVFSATQEIESGAFEAEAWQYYSNEDWQNVIEAARKWLKFQAFSSKPATLGSFVSITFLEDYKTGVEFCLRGLAPNPRDWLLRNNLVVALVFNNEPKEALRQFRFLSSPRSDEQFYHGWCATNGLVLMASGEIEAGREQYREAIMGLNRDGRYFEALLASVFQKRFASRLDKEALSALGPLDVISLPQKSKDPGWQGLLSELSGKAGAQ